MRACCFTGHRDISSAEQRRLIPQLTDEIEKQIAKGVTVFHNGGALGFDMLAALCVLGLRNKYSAIKLYIDVPHSGQADRWSEDKRRQDGAFFMANPGLISAKTDSSNGIGHFATNS